MITFDEYFAAHPRMGDGRTTGPLANGYPVAQTDMSAVVRVEPGTLVFALTAFSGALKGRYVGLGVNAYGDRCVRVELTTAAPGYRRGEVIDVKTGDVYLRHARHVRSGHYYFTPSPLLFV